MDELIRQSITILRGMWQRRWIGLVVAWVVGIVAAVGVMRVPDKYEASARIYVDTQSMLRPLMSGLAYQPNLEQQVAILSRTLISRPNVEKLIRMADLDHGLRSKEDQERLIDAMMKSLVITSAGRSDLYVLSFRDANPEHAKRVVQSMVSIFVESSLGDKRKDTVSAKKFIEDQITSYEKKLEEAEGRLKDFKLKYMDVRQGGGDYFTQMSELNEKLKEVRLELREAENSRDALKQQLTGEGAESLLGAPGGEAEISVPEIDARISALKSSLDGLLQRYTDQHPDVVGTKKLIERLEEQKKEEIEARKKAGAGKVSGPTVNPVLQQLKVALAEAEANVASLRTRAAEYEGRYARLRDSARSIPQIEAEFTQLNRDYEVQRKNYDQLVSRRETASMSEELDAAASVDFRLIDPPRVAPQPVAPNRLLLLALAMVGSLGAGLAGSFLTSLVWPTFHDSRTLREVTGLAVLGSVSLVDNPARKRKERRGLFAFGSAAAALIAGYGAGLLFLAFATLRVV